MRLEEAVAAFCAALEERTHERGPLQWANAQNKLGQALRELGGRQKGTELLEQAVAAYRSALEAFYRPAKDKLTGERFMLQSAKIFGDQGIALCALAERKGDGALALQALRQINRAMETMEAGKFEASAAIFRAQLPVAQALVEKLEGRDAVARALQSPVSEEPAITRLSQRVLESLTAIFRRR
jgi:tetratricopeptide (TPR) repeat protein